MKAKQDLKKGAFYQVTSWFFFAVMYLLSKLIAEDTSLSVRLLFRGMIGMAATLPWILRHGIKSLRIDSYGWMTARALSTTINIALIFFAVETISLVDTTLLTSSAPFFVPFLAWALLHKRISRFLWIPMTVGFIGVIFILKPSSHIFQLGALLALVSGVFNAFSSVATREIGKTIPYHTVLFYIFLVAFVSIIPFAYFNWEVKSAEVYLPLILIGLSTFIAQIFYYKSFEHGEASHIAPFGYSCVIFSGIFDWIFFHEIPDLYSVIGMILVIASGLWILKRCRIADKTF